MDAVPFTGWVVPRNSAQVGLEDNLRDPLLCVSLIIYSNRDFLTMAVFALYRMGLIRDPVGELPGRRLQQQDVGADLRSDRSLLVSASRGEVLRADFRSLSIEEVALRHHDNLRRTDLRALSPTRSHGSAACVGGSRLRSNLGRAYAMHRNMRRFAHRGCSSGRLVRVEAHGNCEVRTVRRSNELSGINLERPSP
jgi:hypothetical protein